MAIDLVDNFNRKIDYLRLSINKNCNFSCVHCDKEGYTVPREDIFLNPEDAAAIVRAFNVVGNIKKVKITGGEPLLHPQIVDVVREISSIPSIEEVSLTTNGFFLPEKAHDLKVAGLTRVNVSLCSLDKDAFTRITGMDGLDKVIEGIDIAMDQRLTPLKLNFVLLKGLNDGELGSIIEFCGKKGIRLQLIELHEIGTVHEGHHDFFSDHYMDASVALERIDIPVDRVEYRHMQNRKIIFFANGASVETVRMTPSFCEGCTKMRVTADGKIKPCLMQACEPFELLGLIREHRPLHEITELIMHAVSSRKPYLTLGSKDMG